MKTILSLAAVAGIASGALADIQDPPSNDYGPTRKLGRGLSNFVWAPTDFFVTLIRSTKQKVIPRGLVMVLYAAWDAQRHDTWLV